MPKRYIVGWPIQLPFKSSPRLGSSHDVAMVGVIIPATYDGYSNYTATSTCHDTQ